MSLLIPAHAMRPSELRAPWLELPANPDHAVHLLPLARSLARVASRARYPTKSIAAFRRENRDLPHLDSVLALVPEELDLLTNAPVEALVPTTTWYGLERTAHLLNRSMEKTKELVRTPAGRRALGWAWWDGHAWKVPAPALDPMMRAAYMATIPMDEPPAHVASLPPWCERT